MVGQDDVSTLADVETVATRVFPCRGFPVGEFLVEDPRVDDHPVAQHQVTFLPCDAGREQMELQHLFAKNDGVPCVVSALKAGDPRGLFSEPVNEFSFAFIAPLSA